MRLLLDAHISPRRVGRRLREHGNDVRSAAEERALEAMPDEDLLATATADDRILVTFDVDDFPAIVRRWAEGGRAHAGCAIVVGIDHAEFGTILRAVERVLTARPDQAAWRDHTVFVGRAAAE